MNRLDPHIASDEMHSMSADEMREKFYDQDHPDLIALAENIMATSHTHTEKIFFALLQRAIDVSSTDSKAHDALKIFAANMNRVETRYYMHQDGKPEREMFTHAIGYLLLGEAYLEKYFHEQQAVDQLHHFITHGEIADRTYLFGQAQKCAIAKLFALQQNPQTEEKEEEEQETHVETLSEPVPVLQ